jgi:hypothetical protein
MSVRLVFGWAARAKVEPSDLFDGSGWSLACAE